MLIMWLKYVMYVVAFGAARRRQNIAFTNKLVR